MTTRALLVVAMAVTVVANAAGCGQGDQGLAERRSALEEVLERYPLDGAEATAIQETTSKGAAGYVSVEGARPEAPSRAVETLMEVLSSLGWEHHDDLVPAGGRFAAAVRATRGDAVLQALVTTDTAAVIRIGKRDSNEAWTQTG